MYFFILRRMHPNISIKIKRFLNLVRTSWKSYTQNSHVSMFKSLSRKFWSRANACLVVKWRIWSRTFISSYTVNPYWNVAILEGVGVFNYVMCVPLKALVTTDLTIFCRGKLLLLLYNMGNTLNKLKQEKILTKKEKKKINGKKKDQYHKLVDLR